MSTPTLDELLWPFAKSISAKAIALKTLYLTNGQRARLNESISDDIKKCSNFISPVVSKAALQASLRLGIDLYDMNWHDQKRFDAGRRTFHFEHMRPVLKIRNECCNASSEDSVLEILKTRILVAWILKIEDANLTRLGYKSNRPDPPGRAYQEAEIEIHKN